MRSPQEENVNNVEVVNEMDFANFSFIHVQPDIEQGHLQVDHRFLSLTSILIETTKIISVDNFFLDLKTITSAVWNWSKHAVKSPIPKPQAEALKLKAKLNFESTQVSSF